MSIFIKTVIQASWYDMHDWEPYSGYHYVYGRHFKWGSRLIAKSFYKIFLSCLKFLFTLLALRILNHYLAFKQYQYRWSSEDEVFPPALTVPGAHGGLAGWGEIWSGPAPPLLREAGDGLHKFREFNSTVIIVLLCKQDCTFSRTI